VIAQAEVKTILKATDNFIRERAANKDNIMSNKVIFIYNDDD
jgi:hypothetical protein